MWTSPPVLWAPNCSFADDPRLWAALHARKLHATPRSARPLAAVLNCLQSKSRGDGRHGPALPHGSQEPWPLRHTAHAMSANALQIVYACVAMVLLTLVVGMLMLLTRVKEMRAKRIHPQAASTSVQMGARLENVQPADNFRNLFELPVLFYALVAVALAVGQVPGWLVTGAWAFVALRILHSLIHCTYNRVYRRLTAFMAGFGVLVGLWVAFAVSLSSHAAA